MNNKDFEDILLSEAKSGNKTSLEKLLINYEKLSYNIAYRIMGNRDDALDLSQEALIKVYRNIKKCKDMVHFKRWLYTIINNCCLDELRKRKHSFTYSIDEPLDTGEGSLQGQYVSEYGEPERALMKGELAAELEDAINKLSPEHRLLIVYREIKGFSYDELAEITGCSIGTVKSRLSRARIKLKNILLASKEQFQTKSVITDKTNKKKKQ